MPVILVGTLDTKGAEVAFVRDRLRAAGLDVLTIDAGSAGPPAFEPDISRDRVFEAAGSSGREIAEHGDRGYAVAKAAEGTARLVSELHESGRVDGVFGLGGSAGTTIGSTAMRALPLGVPKVLVSTLASGQTRPYVGGSDLALFPAVADLAGLNGLTRGVLANAADAMAGMVLGRRRSGEIASGESKPLITATMFGVTTPCVTRARRSLEASGLEVVVFHATGVGGQAMEQLIAQGRVAGVLDLTTTELADELVGGVLSAGPDRLRAAGRAGLPQVVSVGALDMVNFGPRETVPEKFADRLFHVHNPTVTLMRTTPSENAELGRRIASALLESRGPVSLMIPLRGVSALDAPGLPFYTPDADVALFTSLREAIGSSSRVRLIERDEHINDPSFAEAAARELLDLMNRHASRGLDG